MITNAITPIHGHGHVRHHSKSLHTSKSILASRSEASKKKTATEDAAHKLHQLLRIVDREKYELNDSDLTPAQKKTALEKTMRKMGELVSTVVDDLEATGATAHPKAIAGLWAAFAAFIDTMTVNNQLNEAWENLSILVAKAVEEATQTLNNVLRNDQGAIKKYIASHHPSNKHFNSGLAALQEQLTVDQQTYQDQLQKPQGEATTLSNVIKGFGTIMSLLVAVCQAISGTVQSTAQNLAR